MDREYIPRTSSATTQPRKDRNVPKPLLRLVVTLCALARAVHAGVDPMPLRVGIWAESPRKEDSASLRAWAQRTVDDLDRRMQSSGLNVRAYLASFRIVPRGALPLSGGDAHHHPDLRDTSLDLVWGVPFQDDLASARPAALRTWLSNLGCLDERGFLVGWDMFQLPHRPENRLDAADFPIDGGVVRRPSWSLLPDSSLAPACRLAIASMQAGRGPLYSDSRRFAEQVARALSRPLFLEALDASGRPANGALFELWRGRPNPIRAYGTTFEGGPDSLFADSTGRIRFRDAKSVLCGDLPWTHGKNGSCGTAFWRLRHAHRTTSGWLDAGSIQEVAEHQDTLVLQLQLPGGSTRSWKDATSRWPLPWVAAESDSAGTLTIGLSVPSHIDYVLRILDETGRERARTRPMSFGPGVYEKRLEGILTRPGWDVRLDAASSRLQTRITAP